MNKSMVLIGVITLALSFRVSACPDLEGDYICSGTAKPQKVQIQQDLRNDVWTYHLTLGDSDELSVLTDGKTHHVGRFQRIENATYTASCQGETLKVDARGDIIMVGRTFEGRSVMSFSPATNERITSTASLIVNGRNLQKVKLNCRPL